MSLLKLNGGSGAGGAYVYHDRWGYQTSERARQSINSLAAARRCIGFFTVGGARSDRHQHTSAAAFDHPNYWDLTIDWTEMAAGWTVRARLEIVTDSASCSITPRIRNTTDSANIDGTPSTTTSYVEQFVTLPVPGVLGLKRYRLQMIPGLANTGVNIVGCLEIFG